MLYSGEGIQRLSYSATAKATNEAVNVRPVIGAGAKLSTNEWGGVTRHWLEITKELYDELIETEEYVSRYFRDAYFSNVRGIWCEPMSTEVF